MNEPTYCKSCGAYIPEGRKKCLACGFLVEFPPLDGDPDSIETTTLGDTVLRISTAQKDSSRDKSLCFSANDRYERNVKADIDLDKLLKQEFFTVKIGGKVKWFYFGKADMEIGDTIYHTKDLFGNISINHSEKQKFHMVMIER